MRSVINFSFQNSRKKTTQKCCFRCLFTHFRNFRGPMNYHHSLASSNDSSSVGSSVVMLACLQILQDCGLIAKQLKTLSHELDSYISWNRTPSHIAFHQEIESHCCSTSYKLISMCHSPRSIATTSGKPLWESTSSAALTKKIDVGNGNAKANFLEQEVDFQSMSVIHRREMYSQHDSIRHERICHCPVLSWPPFESRDYQELSPFRPWFCSLFCRYGYGAPLVQTQVLIRIKANDENKL